MKSCFQKCFRGMMIFAALMLILLAGVAVYLDLYLYLRPVPRDFDAAIQQQLEAAKMPGAAVVIVKGNRVIFVKGYGYANWEEKRAATPDTVFSIASISKLVTATAVMHLYEQGAFRLDDDIDQYLPFEVRNPKFPDNPITFRMLLAHTSSIHDSQAYFDSYTLGRTEDPTISLADFLQGYLTSTGRDYNPKENFNANAPSAVFDYSNVGFGLLGYLVERISSKPFSLYCKQEVFTPLGMTSAQWFNRDVDPNLMAIHYEYDVLRRVFVPLKNYGYPTYPDGMLKISANDFARFLIVFINNGRTEEGAQFLRQDTIQELLHTQYPKSGDTMGLAWEVDEQRQMYSHDGGDPGISSLTAISTVKDYGFAIFTNGRDDFRQMIGFWMLTHNIYPLVAAYVEQHP